MSLRLTVMQIGGVVLTQGGLSLDSASSWEIHYYHGGERNNKQFLLHQQKLNTGL